MGVLSGWGYRVPVTVTNGSSTSALSYYQVPITLSGSAYTSWAAHGKADGSDIRVTDADGSTLLDFALERIDTANSVVYLLAKVPYVAASGTRTVYVYWGNADATSVSSYAKAIKPSTAVTGPTDVTTQAAYPGYSSFPILVLLKHQTGDYASMNGQVLVFFPNGTGHITGDKKTVMGRSTDGGLNYTLTDILTPAVGYNAEVLNVGEMTDGSLVMIYTYDTAANRIAGTCKHYVAKSTDAGQTWSNLSTSPTNQMTLPWTVGTDAGLAYGRVYPDPSGNLLAPVYGKPSGAARWSQFLQRCPAGSDPTNGSNWTNYATIAAAGASGSWAEAALCLVQGGTKWLAILRDESQTGDLYACTSPDSTGGGTWTAPARINMPNVTVGNNAVSPDLLPLASGNILLSFGVRQWANSAALRGVGHALSTDGGSSWIDRPAAMAMSYTAGTTLARNYGYPSAQQRSDGKILAVGYHDAGGDELANVSRWIMDEDYVANVNNVYTGCESFDSSFVMHGTQCTIDSTQHNNGSSSIKCDNNGGNNAYGQIKLWPTSTGGSAAQKIAMSWWVRPAANGVSGQSIAHQLMDTSTNRTHMSIEATTMKLRWYNGTSHTVLTATAPLNTWTKLTEVAAVSASSVSGKILANNADTGASLGQAVSGSNPDNLRVVAGSSASTNNVVSNFDDVYSHQYAATLPTVSIGSEEVPPSTSNQAVTLAKRAGAVMLLRRLRRLR